MPRAAVVAAIQALEETVAEIDDHVFLRYGTFYGPGTWYALGGPFAAQLRAGGPTDDPAAVFLSRIAANDAVSSFIHLEDAARAAVDALEWPSGAVNIVDDEPARGREWCTAPESGEPGAVHRQDRPALLHLAQEDDRLGRSR
jgi:nucleoside-diphosphate-sugar epimerase